MKRLIISITCLLVVAMASAQERKFSPEKFEEDMESYITREAALTPQEADKLFPLVREMHAKQRQLHGKLKRIYKTKPADEAACEAAIAEYDKVNVELRRIEQCYHKKMLQEISSSKLYDVIKAEYSFHRQWMKSGAKGKKP